MDKNVALMIAAATIAAALPFLQDAVQDVFEDIDVAIEKKKALKQLFDQALIPVLETAITELKKDRDVAAVTAQ